MVVFLPILKLVWTLIPGKRKLAKQAFDAVPGKKKAAKTTGKWICICFLVFILSLSLIGGVIFGVVEWRRHEDEKKAELATHAEYTKRFYGDEAGLWREHWGVKREEEEGMNIRNLWEQPSSATYSPRNEEVREEGAGRGYRRRRRGLKRIE